MNFDTQREWIIVLPYELSIKELMDGEDDSKKLS